MQTFLPYSSFSLTAVSLDDKRLGKQRVEAKQIYLALTQEGYGWQNHPAVLMWEGHLEALAFYGWCMCREWRRRGFKDQLLPWFEERFLAGNIVFPDWMGKDAFHRSHKSNLLRKDKKYYSQFKWKDATGKRLLKDNLPYVWPVKRQTEEDT